VSTAIVNPPLREIRLYGWLGERYGRVHRLAVRTPADAVRLLAANYPGFERDFTGGLEWQTTRWKVWVGQRRIATADEASMLGTSRICISPVIRGAAKLGVLQTIVGLVLIVAGIYFQSPNLVAAGIAMTAGGVLQMLMPIPKADDTRDKNRVFDGPVQLTASGNCVPVAIGRVYTGSVVISGSIHLDSIEDDLPQAVVTVTDPVVVDGVQYTHSEDVMAAWADRITLAGGGGQLQSNAYSRFVDLVSAGPIRGLVNGPESVFLDGVPLRNGDGSFNFDDVFLAARLGTQTQPPILGLDSVENEISVGIVVEQATPVVRAVAGTGLTAVLVRLRWPALIHQTESGKIRGSEVQYAIDLQTGAGAYVTKILDRAIGQFSAPYEQQHRVELSGAGPWNVRVRRITEDPETIRTNNQMRFESFTQVVDQRMRYPRRAIFLLQLNSEQFSSNPERAYHLDGYEGFPIPSNYNPDTRVYTGTWDGTLVPNWTNNPAWVTYGLLTDKLWSVGKRLAIETVEQLKAMLYTIGRYSDEMVPDGAGGMEPRFTLNTWLAGDDDAWKVIDQFFSVFRGMHYWAAGSAQVSQDAPAETMFRFGNANVVGGRFSYEGVSRDAVFSVVIVFYNDPTQMGRRTPVRVQDDDLVKQRGYIEKRVDAFACNSRGQAIRLGRAIIGAAKLERKITRFGVGLEGAMLRPGTVIETSDKRKAGTRLSGRILAATLNSVTLDAPVDLTAGVVYTLTLAERQDQPVTRVLTNAPGSTSTLTWAAALATIPPAMTVWFLGSDQVQPQKFRVINVAEPKPWQFTVQALQYSPEKYDYIDSGRPIAAAPLTSLYQPPPKVEGIIGSEALYIAGSTQLMQVVFSWQSSVSAARYVGTLQADQDNPLSFDVTVPTVAFQGVDPGTYLLTVYAVGANGKRSAAARYSIVLDGIADPPPGLTDMSLAEAGDAIALSWTPPTSVLITAGGYVVIRSYPGPASGAIWNSAVEVGRSPGNSSGVTVPKLPGAYLARTQDINGLLSDDVAYAEYGSPAPGGTLTATATPSTVNKVSTVANPSQMVTVSVSGGSGVNAHSWARLSGDSNIVINSAISATPTFNCPGMFAYDEFAAIWRDTITDSLGATTHVDVPLDFYRRPINGSGGGGTIP
jgi:predicted phage tail protein